MSNLSISVTRTNTVGNISETITRRFSDIEPQENIVARVLETEARAHAAEQTVLSGDDNISKTIADLVAKTEPRRVMPEEHHTKAVMAEMARSGRKTCGRVTAMKIAEAVLNAKP